MGFLIIGLFYGVVVDAKEKGRNIPLWVMITLFTGGLGYVILLFLPSLKSKS
jgi:hypothetical protein